MSDTRVQRETTPTFLVAVVALCAALIAFGIGLVAATRPAKSAAASSDLVAEKTRHRRQDRARRHLDQSQVDHRAEGREGHPARAQQGSGRARSAPQRHRRDEDAEAGRDRDDHDRPVRCVGPGMVHRPGPQGRGNAPRHQRRGNHADRGRRDGEQRVRSERRDDRLQRGDEGRLEALRPRGRAGARRHRARGDVARDREGHGGRAGRAPDALDLQRPGSRSDPARSCR